MLYTFADCVVDTDLQELQRAGMPVKLEPKVYKVLVYLVQHAHRLIPRDELLEHVWPHDYVVSTAVARCITAIRQAVGDNADAQRVIQTRHRQGYRLVAPVTVFPASKNTTEYLYTLPVSSKPTASILPDTLKAELRQEIGINFYFPEVPLDDVALLNHPCYATDNKGEIIGLNLSNLSLSEIPWTLAQLPFLHTLRLHGNNLTSLPSAMADLSTLTRLYLPGNRFTEFPPVISELKSLEILALNRNTLTTLPTSRA